MCHQLILFDTKDTLDITTTISLSTSSCSVKCNCLTVPPPCHLFGCLLQSLTQWLGLFQTKHIFTKFCISLLRTPISGMFPISHSVLVEVIPSNQTKLVKPSLQKLDHTSFGLYYFEKQFWVCQLNDPTCTTIDDFRAKARSICCHNTRQKDLSLFDQNNHINISNNILDIILLAIFNL